MAHHAKWIYRAARREESAVWCCQRADFTPSLTTRHRFSNYLPSAPCFVAQQCGRARAFLCECDDDICHVPFSPQQTIIKSTSTRRNFKSLISPSSSWTACYFSNKRSSLFSFQHFVWNQRDEKEMRDSSSRQINFHFFLFTGQNILCNFFRCHSCCCSHITL
jgi:hypothetical protein